MKGYADYVFYREQYHGQMEEEDFNRHMLSATQYIRYLTMGKADQYAGEELKYAACEAADIYFSVSVSDLSKAGSGRVKSESNDGYSVTFATEGKDGETSEELASRKVSFVIRKWLLPTGLLRRKVRCAHDYQCGHHAL